MPMNRWLESLMLGGALALTLFLLSLRTALSAWLIPVFYIPYLTAAVMARNAHLPNPWWFGAILVLQCSLVVFVVGWLFGRYRGRARGD